MMVQLGGPMPASHATDVNAFSSAALQLPSPLLWPPLQAQRWLAGGGGDAPGPGCLQVKAGSQVHDTA